MANLPALEPGRRLLLKAGPLKGRAGLRLDPVRHRWVRATPKSSSSSRPALTNARTNARHVTVVRGMRSAEFHDLQQRTVMPKGKHCAQVGSRMEGWAHDLANMGRGGVVATWTAPPGTLRRGNKDGHWITQVEHEHGGLQVAAGTLQSRDELAAAAVQRSAARNQVVPHLVPGAKVIGTKTSGDVEIMARQGRSYVVRPLFHKPQGTDSYQALRTAREREQRASRAYREARDAQHWVQLIGAEKFLLDQPHRHVPDEDEINALVHEWLAASQEVQHLEPKAREEDAAVRWRWKESHWPMNFQHGFMIEMPDGQEHDLYEAGRRWWDDIAEKMNRRYHKSLDWRWVRLVLRKAHKGYDYCSTQVNLEPALAQRIRAWVKANIDPADLYPMENEGEGTPHITVKYGLKRDDPQSAKKVLEALPPFEATLGKIGAFHNSPDYDVLMVRVRSGCLQRANDRLSQALPCVTTFKQYHPHVTLAYLKPDTARKYVGGNDFRGTDMRFDTVQFSARDGSFHPIKLRGTDEKMTKSQVKGYTRRTKSGKAVQVAPHTDKRTKKAKPVAQEGVLGFTAQGGTAHGGVLDQGTTNEKRGDISNSQWPDPVDASYELQVLSHSKFPTDALRRMVAGKLNQATFGTCVSNSGKSRYRILSASPDFAQGGVVRFQRLLDGEFFNFRIGPDLRWTAKSETHEAREKEGQARRAGIERGKTGLWKQHPHLVEAMKKIEANRSGVEDHVYAGAMMDWLLSGRQGPQPKPGDYKGVSFPQAILNQVAQAFKRRAATAKLLQKSQVQGYYRRDPRTGKRILVSAHTDSRTLTNPHLKRLQGRTIQRDRQGTYTQDYQTPAGKPKRRQRVKFEYRHVHNGKPVDAKTHARIQALNLPDSWEDVWINPDPEATLQAEGVAPNGKHQAMWHTDRVGESNQLKWERLAAFAEKLPRLRARVLKDLNSRDPLKRQAARVIYLIDQTAFRAGSLEEGRGQEPSYGACTLKCGHVKVQGDTVHFAFRTKNGPIQKAVQDKTLARIVREHGRGKPDQGLFSVPYNEVLKYFRSIVGPEHKLHDFRGYHANRIVAEEIARRRTPKDQAAFKRVQREILDAAADQLGDSRAMAKKAYVSPLVFAKWESALARKQGAVSRQKAGPAKGKTAKRAVLKTKKKGAARLVKGWVQNYYRKHPKTGKVAQVGGYYARPKKARPMSVPHPLIGQPLVGHRLSPHVEAAMVRPQLQASVAKLWQLEAVSTYQHGDFPFLAVREMLQNGVDAIRKAQQDGQLKAGQGRIEVTLDEKTHTITFRDNGIGMSWDDIQDKFLTLGSSGKSEAGETGGFGVAKAIILGSSKTRDWTIKTRDNVLHSSQLDTKVNARDLRGPYLQGTEITIRDVDRWDYRSWERTSLEAVRALLASSDIPGVTITLNGATVDSRFAGARGVRMTNWEAGWGDNTQVVIKSYKTAQDRGSCVIRLNGQLQFEYPMSNVKHKCVLLDVTTTERPGTEEYPLGRSRDGFSSGRSCLSRFRDLVSYLERETESSDREMEWEDEYFENPFQHLPQAAAPSMGAPSGISGLRQMLTGVLQGAPDLSAQPDPTKRGQTKPTSLVASERRVADARLAEQARLLQEKLLPVLESLGYQDSGIEWTVRRNRKTYGKKKFEVRDHLPLLMAWNAISHLIEQHLGADRISAAGFGAGFILDPGVNAQAQNNPFNNHQYVLVNPDIAEAVIAAAKKAKNPWAITGWLKDMACHEMAHLTNMGAGHNENFTVHREDIGLRSSDLLPELNRVVEACFFGGATSASGAMQKLGPIKEPKAKSQGVGRARKPGYRLYSQLDYDEKRAYYAKYRYVEDGWIIIERATETRVGDAVYASEAKAKGYCKTKCEMEAYKQWKAREKEQEKAKWW